MRVADSSWLRSMNRPAPSRFRATSAAQIAEPVARMQALSTDLDMLSGLMATLKVDDATQRTRMVEAISEIYAKLNQAKDLLLKRR